MEKQAWIDRNKDYTFIDGKTGFTINFAGIKFTDAELEGMTAQLDKAYSEVLKIEAGDIKNPDENRQVTHFTDRINYPQSDVFADVEKFVEAVRTGAITGSTGKKLESAVINGIGGSALGPQLVQFALNGPYWNEWSDAKRDGYLKLYFTDNTDSAGFNDIINVADLERTLVVNISKSGGTQETKNNMISFENEYKKAGLDFAKHACAITMKGSQLDQHANSQGWLAIFEMAESIGGRTSETNIVGHVPAALAGVDFKAMLEGACHMDELTRNKTFKENPAYMLASMWYLSGKGKGDRNMVIVPYSDRLILMSRYLQQLVMESIGKELDLDGNTVHQGLNVFGNKGGTDAHAFIQQLNDGRDDFFVTFIEVLKDAKNLPIDGDVVMGDFLHGFQAGLAGALLNKGRQVIQMTLNDVDAHTIGMLIALYERAVAVYAELIHINAFHQPGVQAYKLESKVIIDLLLSVQSKIADVKGFTGTAAELAEKLNMADKELEIDGIMAKFAENCQNRTVSGLTITRKWENSNWCYSVK